MPSKPIGFVPSVLFGFLLFDFGFYYIYYHMELLSEFFAPIPLVALGLVIFGLVAFWAFARFFRMPEGFKKSEAVRDDIRFKLVERDLIEEAEAEAAAAEAAEAEAKAKEAAAAPTEEPKPEEVKVK